MSSLRKGAELVSISGASASSAQSARYWRTLAERDGEANADEEFAAAVDAADDPKNRPHRRDILRALAASLSLGGLAACTRQPPEQIVPYVKQPENVTPGLPLFYATAMPQNGFGFGLLVESHLNRPTKVEGNPDHPASLGATDAFAQASILTLYDPERSQRVLFHGRESTWGEFQIDLLRRAERASAKRGAGLAVVTGDTTSPTLIAQIKALQTAMPEAQWYQHVGGSDSAAEFGAAFSSQLDLSVADVVVSLESDFLNCGPQKLVNARRFARRRKAMSKERGPGRLYVFESTPTVTGSMADHRIPAESSRIPEIARQLAAALGIAAAQRGAAPSAEVTAAAKDLQVARGRGLVVAGEYQPPEVHALAHAMNVALDNLGSTIRYFEPVREATGRLLPELVSELNAGRVETLLLLGVNPVYSAPATLQFQRALDRAQWVAHLGLYFDETANRSHWHINEAHYLESWSDIRAYDGTIAIQQPLIAPMYEGRSCLEVLAMLTGQPGSSPHALVKDYWRARHGESNFDGFWKTALHDGIVPGTEVRELSTQPPVRLPQVSQLDGTASSLEVILRPDETVGDGSYSENAWLQELPKPSNKLTWDNTVWVSPILAGRLHLENGDVVRVTAAGRHVEGPVYVMPGQAANTVCVQMGYGRFGSSRLSRNMGYNAFLLQDAVSPFLLRGASIQKTGKTYELASTQTMQGMAGRDPVRHIAWRAGVEPEAPKEEEAPSPDMTLYPQYPYTGYRWAMTIDTSACNGCSACVIACQAENNIPVVGKDQVIRHRHMHWLRVDRYHAGTMEAPAMYNQPVPCMHCENAPCEVVCPVAATVHSDEGLNEMVYNRCVGTRYCSNNCPYKVRRFNFLLYSDWKSGSLKGMRNPEVTVRSRGVMEKCTYCVQRIEEARARSEKENRRIRDGEVQTACQQVCPAQAIVFGDLNTEGSAVARLQQSRLNYHLLEELNTRPRTTYLAAVKNANSSLEGTRDNRESD